MGALTGWIEREVIGANGPEWDYAPTSMGEICARCIIAGRAIWFYASKILFPVTLLFSYLRWNINPGAWWQYLLPALSAGRADFAVGIATSHRSRAARGDSVLRRHAVSGAGVRQRFPDAVFVRRRSLRLPGEHRADRRHHREPGARDRANGRAEHAERRRRACGDRHPAGRAGASHEQPGDDVSEPAHAVGNDAARHEQEIGDGFEQFRLVDPAQSPERL